MTSGLLLLFIGLAGLAALYKLLLLVASSLYLRQLTRSGKCSGINAVSRELPSVSVIIPVRNEERVIEKLFYSLSQLSYPKTLLEIIFIDDNSTDATPDLINKYITDNYGCDIKYVRSNQKQARGKSPLLNQGLQLAKNEFLAFYDADTFMEPDSLTCLIAVLLEDKNIDIAMGVSLPLSPTENLLTYLNYLETIYYDWVLLPAQYQLYGVIFPSGRNYAARKKSIEEAGGWNENSVGEDYELGLRMLKAKRVNIKIIPQARAKEITSRTFQAWFSQRIRWNRLNLDTVSAFFANFGDFLKYGNWIKAVPNLANHLWDNSLIILFYILLLIGIFAKPGFIFWSALFSTALVYMFVYSIGYLVASKREGEINAAGISRIPLMWLVYQQMIFLSVCQAVFLKIVMGTMTKRERTEKTIIH